MKTSSEKIKSICNELPDPCHSFLLETGTEMAISTRLCYARELRLFFNYMKNNTPVFDGSEITDLGYEDLKKITSQHISRYLTLTMDDQCKERTIHRKRATLSRFFSYLVDNRLIDYNPVSAAVKVKVHQSDVVVYLDFDEQESLLSTVDCGSGLDQKKLKYHGRYRLRDIALITLLLDTGMRVSEINGINISDLDLDKFSVIVTRKGGNKETLYYSDDAKDSIIDYIKEKKMKFTDIPDNAPLFSTNLDPEQRLGIRAIQKLVKKYSLAAIPGKGNKISVHKLRSSFAMSYYKARPNILELQKKLGHKNITTTNIYAKATDEQMLDTRSVISDYRQEQKRGI